MKTLIEFAGHSGLGKSTLAYYVAAQSKASGANTELHQESIKTRIFDKGMCPNKCREEDTNQIVLLSKYYDYVVTDSNAFSGYIFGDIGLRDSVEEAVVRYKPFDQIISVLLVPEGTDIKISEGLRKEKEINPSIVSRCKDVEIPHPYLFGERLKAERKVVTIRLLNDRVNSSNIGRFSKSVWVTLDTFGYSGGGKASRRG